LQPPYLAAGSFQRSTPLSSDMGQVLDKNDLGNYSPVMQGYVASIRENAKFIASMFYHLPLYM
jgi:hypothetical protein